jgi:hypothetical protein
MMMSVTDKASAMAALKKRGSLKDKGARRKLIQQCAKYAPQEARKAMMADQKAGMI